MRVFVPLEDAGIDDSAGLLVPYRQGVPCVRGLREDGGFAMSVEGWLEFGALNDGSAARHPDARPAHPPGRR